MSDELNKEQGVATEASEQQTQPQQEAQPQYGQPGPEQPQYGQPPQYEQNPGNPYYAGEREKMTGIGEAYVSYWRNYANFNDRTSRAGYWWVFLIHGIISIILYVVILVPLVAAIVTNQMMSSSSILGGGYGSILSISGAFFTGAGIIYFVWCLANIVPQLAIIVRRLHDTGKPWPYMLIFILICVIPIAGVIAGFIIWIVFMTKATKYPPENRFYNLPRQG
jgi:uncharacterized membrane protein YhaH (DUF805 family)